MSSRLPSETIKELEQILRILIKDELSRNCPDWWNSMVPPDIRTRAESLKRQNDEQHFPSGQEHNVIEYLSFPNYMNIMDYEQNWSSSFESIFRDKYALTARLRDLARIRNDISHSRDLTDIDESTLQLFDQAIRAAIDNYKEKQYIDEGPSQLFEPDTRAVIHNYNKKQYVDEKTSSDFEEFATHPLTLNISSDKPIYPVGAFVHIYATLPYVLAGEYIIFQLFNARRELCAEELLDPQTYDKSVNTYQMTFHISESEGRVGDVLYAKVRHGQAVATDQWSIEQRESIIRTDKPVYMVNSDMIVTVLDPDADKNSQQVEFIGDREDSKLIIESKYGRIDGYKLRETGDSTGIFQGIIRILGIKKDGTVIKQEFNGQIIDKIQGTGLEDGFIGASLGETIKLRYKNKSGESSNIIYVSDFGATIELDKTTYKPNDIVYITIVVPDLSFRSNTPDKVGNDLASKLRIRTRNDTIPNYHLFETGHNTGIFAGQIQLGSNFERLAEKLGPNNGTINCEYEDFIEISFTYFDYTIVSNAKILP